MRFKDKKERHPNTCHTCDAFPCRCPGGGADHSQPDYERVSTHHFSAVEIIITNPHLLPLPRGQRESHENLRLKERFKQYLSIGVYREDSELKYYFFQKRNQKPVKTYPNLIELSKELPEELKDLFQSQPKLFLMGHGHGGRYGLSGNHFSEEIYGDDFDRILSDFKNTLPKDHNEIMVTLEGCNVANRQQDDEKKSFLERLSEKHQEITFSGSAPWKPDEPSTGYRASGGYPKLNLPITSMVGSVWKSGNRVIFYHENRQVVVSKSMLATTNSAKKLKINTIKYANEVLKEHEAKEAILQIICESPDISKIEDLKKVSGFSQESFPKNTTIKELEYNEKKILPYEKRRYISRVKEIVKRSKSNEKIESRDLLIIVFGLKDTLLFKGHEDLYNKLLTKANRELLKLVMVESGKVLIAGPDNNNIIDWLVSHDIDINSVDKDGMTALHYAAHLFYVYREEPLNLIEKLLNSGANVDAKDNQERTPLLLASEFGHIEVVKKLLTRGASRDITDHQGRTPLMLAKQNDHNDIVQLLKSNCSVASMISCLSLWSRDDSVDKNKRKRDDSVDGNKSNENLNIKTTCLDI